MAAVSSLTLILAGALTVAAALAHLACIAIGAPAYRFNLNPAVTPPPSSPQAVLAARSSGQCDHRYSATDKPRDPPA